MHCCLRNVVLGGGASCCYYLVIINHCNNSRYKSTIERWRFLTFSLFYPGGRGGVENRPGASCEERSPWLITFNLTQLILVGVILNFPGGHPANLRHRDVVCLPLPPFHWSTDRFRFSESVWPFSWLMGTVRFLGRQQLIYLLVF